MEIGGFQKLTLLDYPGQVACIVFTKGCNFRCPFCHNGDLVLPEKSRSGNGEGMSQDEGGGKECQTAMHEDTAFSYLEKRKGILDGVVVTGGEPLLQPDLLSFLERVRSLGYRIKLDTNGSFPGRLREILEQGLADYVAMDVKQELGQYGAACGVEGGAFLPGLLSKIEESLALLRTSGIPFELRTTVVKGIHRKADMEALARWLAERLALHDSAFDSEQDFGRGVWYLQPYVPSGQVIAPRGLSAFSEEEMEEVLATVRGIYPGAKLRR